MTKDEALKLALAWLDTDDSQKIKMAKHFIEQALAQPEQKPKAWKHFTKPLERRLEHLQLKEHQNSFDKHEIFALKHVLWVVKQPKQKPLSKD